MKTTILEVLLFLAIFTPLASGQVLEGDYISPVPVHLWLMPKDFLRIRPLPKANLITTRFRTDAIVPIWLDRFQRPDKQRDETAIPGLLSAEAAKIQLAVMRHSYHRLGAGSFGTRLLYSLKEGIMEDSNYRYAAVYYGSSRGILGSNSPLARYYHDRETDPAGVILRQLIIAAKRGASGEFQPDAIRILKGWLKKF